MIGTDEADNKEEFLSRKVEAELGEHLLQASKDPDYIVMVNYPLTVVSRVARRLNIDLENINVLSAPGMCIDNFAELKGRLEGGL
jgi:hypothetical protein